MTVADFIDKHEPCSTGADFALTFRSMREVWDALASGKGRPDWLVWLASRDGIVDRKVLVRATVHAVRKTVGHLLKDPRSTKALDVAEAWANGKATLDDVREAEKAAYDAVHAAYVHAAYAAARAAYYAANAADAAACAAYAYAADAAAYAYAYAAYAAARAANAAAAYETFREIFAKEIPNPFEE